MSEINKSLKVVKKNLKTHTDQEYDEFDAKIDALSEWNDVLDDEDRKHAFEGDS
jgi:hypothetical protein